MLVSHLAWPQHSGCGYLFFPSPVQAKGTAAFAFGDDEFELGVSLTYARQVLYQ